MFCRMLGVFIILPVATGLTGGDVVLYGRALHGWEQGLLLSGYGLTQACLQIPLGLAADRWGRKRVLLFALAVFVLGSVLAAVASSPLLLIIGRLVQGCGAVAAVITAWIADVAPKERRTPAMAVFGGSIALAFVVSLLLAAPLAVWSGGELSFLFKVAAGAGAGAFVLLLFLPSTNHAPHAMASANAAGGVVKLSAAFSQLLKNRALYQCAVGAFVLHYALASVFFLLPLLLLPHLELQQQWQVYAGGFFASLLLAVPLLLRIDHLPYLFSAAQVFLLAGAAVLLLLAAGAAFVPPRVLAALALCLFFAGFIPLEATIPARAARATDKTKQHGGGMGFVYTAQFLGIFVGGALCGICYGFGGYSLAIGITCIIIAGWCVLHGKLERAGTTL